MIQKQPVNINFSQGVDTKTDPWQVQAGRFLSLENTIFLKGGLLQKRNGFEKLTNLNETASYLTTFQNNLTAVGSYLQSYSSGTNSWVTQGAVQPVGLSVLSLVKNNLNQTQSDSAISNTNLICTVYTENNSGTNQYKYVVADADTGQNVIDPTPITNADPTLGVARVFVLSTYFIILYTKKVGALYYLEYIALNVNNPALISGPTVLNVAVSPNVQVAFDGTVLNDTLYIAFNTIGGVEHIRLTNSLVFSALTLIDGLHPSTMVRVCQDTLKQTIWITYFSSATNNCYTARINLAGNVELAATLVLGAPPVIVQMTTSALNGTLNIMYEVGATYTYNAVPTHYIAKRTVTSVGGVSAETILKRSVGIASKAFIYNNTTYVLTCYVSAYQTTYFLLDFNGTIIAKLAYQNGAGYYTGAAGNQGAALPSCTVIQDVVCIPYLYKLLITPVNRNINIPAGSQTAGVYAQLGVNLAKFNFAAVSDSAEIGSNLNLTGGYTYAYDGYSVTEQNFHLYPDNVTATMSLVGGSMNTNLSYYYCVTYEWSDNQGNLFRSAPSIPVSVASLGVGNTGSVTLKIPYLRLTNKISNPVKLCVYRWSSGQSTFYQTIANYLTAPTLNDPTQDFVTVVDTLADSSILGNPILYITGGVLENIGPPSFKNVFLFDSRLWGISSEDPNLLWFSKQVIESTPVEMSDFLTVYIPPSLGAQGPSGDLVAGFPMDDKAILFKKASISYFNGTGPDNTGANNNYSAPFLVTTTLGCSNPKSIVFMPNGLMFEFASEAGNQIWLLARDLSTHYIGAPVEALTQNATVQSAVNIPGTNQVRFTMSSGITLMYDYFYQQWGTFTNIPSISSTLYQGVQTFINSRQEVYIETPGKYLDGTRPVLMKFTTSWINLMGIQGYQRAYFFYLLGRYYSPHKLYCQIAYDFLDSPEQASLITPINFNPAYGSNAGNGQNLVYGQLSPYGGASNVEQWRVFLTKQRCSAFQITISELFDASYGQEAGAGLTLSGLNLIIGAKKSFKPIAAAQSIGG